MATESLRASWNQTSMLAAILANANRDPKKKPEPFQPDDFHPLAKRETKPLEADISILKLLLGKHGNS